MTLLVEDLGITGPDGAIVRGVAFQARPGVPLVLLGETGSGKSLVAQAVMGTLPPGLRATGRIVLDGVALSALPLSARRALWGRRIAMLPQEPWAALDPTMVVQDQVAEVHRLVHGRGRRDSRTLAQAALARLGIGPVRRRFPFQLSGGMNQRAAFAASQAADAAVLIADEPTKGLDAALRDTVAALLRQDADAGRILLVITHDVELARQLGGEGVVMLDGAAIEAGPLHALLSAPRHAYTRRLIGAAPERWAPWQRHCGGAPVVTATGLRKRLGGRELFGGRDLVIPAGSVVAVAGPSGCGKTTLGNLLLGLLRPDGGTVTRAPGLAPIRLQKLYQDPLAAFAPRQRLGSAVQELVRRHGLSDRAVPPLIARLRLSAALLDRYPDQVSGGELQRFGLLRTLLLDPALLFADEVTSRLDPVTQQEVMDLLREVVAERGTALLVVTHEAALAQKVAGEVIRLDAVQ